MAVGAAILAAILLNGAESFLLRVGAVEREKYEAAWVSLCAEAGVERSPYGLGARCAPAPRGALLPVLWPRVRAAATAHTLKTSGTGVVLKLAKDACLLALGVVSAALFWRGRDRVPLLGRLPLIGLGALLALHAAAGLLRGETLPVLAGLRSFEVLPIAILLPPLVAISRCDGLVRWVTISLVSQVPLLVVEAVRSLPVQKVAPLMNLPWRLSGSLVMPNALGVFGAVGLVFVLVFERSPVWKWMATAAALVCVAASGSGAGWVLLAAAGLWKAWTGGRGTRRAGALVVSALVLALLPRLVIRPDVYDSLRARAESLASAATRPFGELLVGGALGAGTTTVVTVDSAGPYSYGGRWWWAGDSGVAALLAQAGVVGLVLALLALAAAWRTDRRGRPILLTIALAAFVIPVLDLFPVNLLLAIVLARVPAGDVPPNPGVT